MTELAHSRKRRLWYFIKFFEQERWADQFLAGDLYLNTIHYFKTLESSDTADRRDPTEATFLWVQPKDATIKLQVPKLNLKAVITGKDLAAPLQVSSTFHESFHVLCLTAPETDTPVIESGAIANLDVIHQQLQLDQRCFRMGQFAVVVPVLALLERIHGCLKRNGLAASQNMVTYYDDSSFSGHFSASEIPFRKQKRFAYQREWRLCVKFHIDTHDAMRLHIGRLPEGAFKLSAIDFPRLNEIRICLGTTTS
jgi:hypothetical protein